MGSDPYTGQYFYMVKMLAPDRDELDGAEDVGGFA